MKAVMKRELKNYYKNPIFWIGILVLLVGVYKDVSPYLQLHYVKSESEWKEVPKNKRRDVDIADGYIPAGKERQWEMGYQEIKSIFMEGFGYSEKEAQNIIDELKGKNLSISELSVYLVENYDFYGADQIMEDGEFYRGTVEEVNTYLKTKMGEHPFSYYFSRKFADFAGLYMGFFAMILLAFLFLRDMKKDTYELLHTKPVTAGAYMTGKAAGGLLAMLSALGILTVIFTILCEIAGRRAGLPVRVWDLLLACVQYIVPNLCMITAVYAMIAVLFKTPVPAAPLLFLYMIYSNMGSTGPDGRFGYYGRPLAIMVRFPGQFLETAPPPYVLLNQTFLILASVLLLAGAAALWKRRKS